VVRWIDKSGNDYSPSNSSNRPQYLTNQINGKPVIDFVGNERLLFSPVLDIGTDWTAFVITTFPKTIASWATMFRGNTADHQIIINSSEKLGMYDNAGGGAFRDSGFNTLNLSTDGHKKNGSGENEAVGLEHFRKDSLIIVIYPAFSQPVTGIALDAGSDFEIGQTQVFGLGAGGLGSGEGLAKEQVGAAFDPYYYHDNTDFIGGFRHSYNRIFTKVPDRYCRDYGVLCC